MNGRAEASAPLAFFGAVGRFFDVAQLGHFPADFFLDDFQQRDVRGTEAGDVSDQGTADGTAAGIELAHAARDEVDQNVGVANFLQSLFAKFSVQDFYRLQEPKRIMESRHEAMEKGWESWGDQRRSEGLRNLLGCNSFHTRWHGERWAIGRYDAVVEAKSHGWENLNGKNCSHKRVIVITWRTSEDGSDSGTPRSFLGKLLAAAAKATVPNRYTPYRGTGNIGVEAQAHCREEQDGFSLLRMKQHCHQASYESSGHYD